MGRARGSTRSAAIGAATLALGLLVGPGTSSVARAGDTGGLLLHGYQLPGSSDLAFAQPIFIPYTLPLTAPLGNAVVEMLASANPAHRTTRGAALLGARTRIESGAEPMTDTLVARTQWDWGQTHHMTIANFAGTEPFVVDWDMTGTLVFTDTVPSPEIRVDVGWGLELPGGQTQPLYGGSARIRGDGSTHVDGDLLSDLVLDPVGRNRWTWSIIKRPLTLTLTENAQTRVRSSVSIRTTLPKGSKNGGALADFSDGLSFEVRSTSPDAEASPIPALGSGPFTRCDALALGNGLFGPGDDVVIETLRIANTTPAALPARLQLELELPNGVTLDLLDVNGIALPPGFDNQIGPVKLFEVTANKPAGPYEFRCILSDPSTGYVYELGSAPFIVL